MTEQENLSADKADKKPGKGGRHPKKDPSTHRYVFRLTDEENAKFLSMFELSGLDNKARFVVSILFEKQIKVVKIDKAAMDYYTRLTHLYGQFRSIGVNYNQVVKQLNTGLSEKKARYLLYNLEQETIKLVTIMQQILELTKKFEQQFFKT